jgi:fatty-acyl-CoA synthase
MNPFGRSRDCAHVPSGGARSRAVIGGVPHPKWHERPLAAIVTSDGIPVSAEELRNFLSLRFLKWQIPDARVFAKEIPRTSVGTFLKSKLREQYASWKGD